MPIQSSAKAIPFFQLKAGPAFRAREPHPPASQLKVGVAQYSELYCEAGGSNMNGGSNSGAVKYASTNGNWDGNNIFTPTDGSNPYGQIQIDDAINVFLDGATTPVFIGRVAGVQNATNGQILVHSTNRAGSPPTSGATGRSVRVGGAWLGPNGTAGFPFVMGAGQLGALRNSNSDAVRINFKNDQTYSITSGISQGSGTQRVFVQGYTSVVGDGGKATLDGGSSTAILFSGVNSPITWTDFIFTTSVASGTSAMYSTGGYHSMIRCVFKNARGAGFSDGTGSCNVIECEFYNCNNSAGNSGAIVSNIGTYIVRCIIHECYNAGIYLVAGGAIVKDCIFAKIYGGKGIFISSTSVNGILVISNCDFYKCTTAGIAMATSAANPQYIDSCNFVKCGTGVLNSSGRAFIGNIGLIQNCGYYDNLSPDTLGGMEESGKIAYPSMIYNDPENGDFRIIEPRVVGAGRGMFTITTGYSSSTTVYPNIGATPPALLSTWGGNSIVLPSGFVGTSYNYQWTFAENTTLTLYSGSLPSGLLLRKLENNIWALSGTPDSIADYTFVLQAATPQGGTGNTTFAMSVGAAAATGFSFVRGG